MDPLCSKNGRILRFDGIERIAVFQALHLGDFLCGVPALRALRARFPAAEVTLIGLRWLHGFVGRFRYIDRFLEFPGYEGLEDIPWDAERTEQFLAEARSERYGLAIQMHGNGPQSNCFVAHLGAGITVGYQAGDRTRTQELDLELMPEPRDHETARWLRLVGTLGAIGSPDMECPITLEDWEEAERVANQEGIEVGIPLIGLHPGARDLDKRWPVESFIQTGDALGKALRAQVVVTGAEDEYVLAAQVAESIQGTGVNLAGKTSVGGLAALMTRMRLLVTNDTGPSHLAAALGTPSLVLFGPTDPARWAPLNERVHRVLSPNNNGAISSIRVESVVEEALGLVERCNYLTS